MSQLVADEKTGSPKITVSPDKPSAKRSWWMAYSENEGEVLALAKQIVPATFAGLPLQQYDLSCQGSGIWDLDADYSIKEAKDAARSDQPPSDTSPTTVSFDTTGGTQKITQSLTTQRSLARPGKVAPDFKGAIGVDSDSVDGVEITVPVFNWTEKHFFLARDVTWDYLFVLHAMTGRVNSRTFRNKFGPFEVLFMGASGDVVINPQHEPGTLEKVEISFKFSAQPTRIDFQVGDITVPAKLGWEYLWIRYSDSVDVRAKSPVKIPTAAYVERVYLQEDFAQLKIGS